MKISQVKALLPSLESLKFKLENGSLVPVHFHVTEIGMITKKFIDCGGTIRDETTVNFQLWDAEDYDHRLEPAKLLHIIELSEKKLGIQDAEIEVEYQSETIGKYGLAFENNTFVLTSKQTDCLAKGNCGVPKVELQTQNSCVPGGGCC